MKSVKSPLMLGIMICLLGAVCFSTKAIFVKLAYRDTNVEAVSLLALRMIFSLPFFATSALISSGKKDNVRFTHRQWLQVAAVGCMGYYVSSLLDFLGLQYVSAGIERLILFIYPTLVLLMNSLLFREKIKPVQWYAVGITYGGLLLAFLSEGQFQEAASEDFLWGSLLVFICAFTYAAYIVGSGKLIPVVGASKFNSYAMSFASVGVLLHFSIKGSQSVLDLSFTTYSYGFLMAILGTVIPSYLVAEGIRRVGPDNAAIIGSVGPVSTLLLAYIFLDESISTLQLMGTAMILLGVFVISRGKTAST